MPGVTDVHVHLEPYKSLRPEVLRAMRREFAALRGRERLFEDPRAFLDHLDSVGVERACLISYVAPEVTGLKEDVNRFVSEFAREDPARLLPFGSVHPRRTKDPRRDVERLASKLDIRGVKVHPPHQLFAATAYADGRLPALRTVYRTAERIGLPVMVHTGTSVFPGARSKYGDPMALDDVAQDFPDLTLIMAHGGRPLWCDAAFYLVRRHANVYLDISSIPPKRLLEWFPRIGEIPDKILFGSDWPGPGVPGIREEVEALRGLPLPLEVQEKLFVTNARRVLR
ncbi:MAG: amidohydrolase family protein [Methanobacteriota archaeon]